MPLGSFALKTRWLYPDYQMGLIPGSMPGNFWGEAYLASAKAIPHHSTSLTVER